MQSKISIDPLQIRLGLSIRKKLPVFYVGSCNYPIWQYRQLQAAINALPRGTALRGDYFRVWLMERASWLEWYLPPFSLEGKTVLDVGAGCGESAAFYIRHGAKKVICIEPDHELLPYLRHNAEIMPLEIINENFRLNHLDLPHDFMKMDIEGWEAELLADPGRMHQLKPSAIEIHNCWLLGQFMEQGFYCQNTVQQPGTGMGWYIVNNYRAPWE